MSLGLLGFGGWEIIVILAVILILIFAKKLPEIGKGLGTGLDEFKKATREMTREVQDILADQSESKDPRETERLGHPLLMALTFILGVVCLVLVWYEVSK
jgi:sec-independent protein translocase protein TatA